MSRSAPVTGWDTPPVSSYHTQLLVTSSSMKESPGYVVVTFTSHKDNTSNPALFLAWGDDYLPLLKLGMSCLCVQCRVVFYLAVMVVRDKTDPHPRVDQLYPLFTVSRHSLCNHYMHNVSHFLSFCKPPIFSKRHLC